MNQHNDTFTDTPGLGGASPLTGDEPSLGGALNLGRIHEALAEADHDRREALIHQLRRVRDADSIPILIEMLTHEHARVRRHAARLLGDIGSPTPVEALIHALSDDHIAVRRHVALALGRIGLGSADRALQEQITVELLTALEDENAFVRTGAASYVRRIGPLLAPGATRNQVVDALITALNDTNSVVCNLAAEGLGAIRDRRAVEGLISLFGDNRVQIRTTASRALERIVDSCEPAELDIEVIPALVDALQTAPTVARSAAAYVLGKVNPLPLAAETRTRLLDGMLDALKDEDWTVRRWAALGLGSARDSRPVDALHKTLDDNDEVVRACAVRTLGILLARFPDYPQAERVTSRLIGLLADEEELIPPVAGLDRVCDVAVEALGRVDSPEALEAIRSWENG